MSKETYLDNRQRAYDWLVLHFPEAFSAKAPLKIGIHKDIFAFEDENKPAKCQLHKAIYMHVRRAAYLNKLRCGTERVDLSGEECGQTVSEDEEEKAIELEKKIKLYYKKEHRKRKVALKSESTPNEEVSPPPLEEKSETDTKKSGRKILKLKKKKISEPA